MFIRHTEESIDKLLSGITKKTRPHDCPEVFYFPEPGAETDRQKIIRARLIKRVNKKVVAILPIEYTHPRTERKIICRQRRVDFRKLHSYRILHYHGFPPLPGPIPYLLTGNIPARLIVQTDLDFAEVCQRTIINADTFGLVIDPDDGKWYFRYCYKIMTNLKDTFFLVTNNADDPMKSDFIDLPFDKTFSITELLPGRYGFLHYIRWLNPKYNNTLKRGLI